MGATGCSSVTFPADLAYHGMPTYPHQTNRAGCKLQTEVFESIAGWLVWLWETGADGILLTGDDLKYVFSHHPPVFRIHGARTQDTFLLWPMAGCRAVWPNEEALPFSNPHWTSLLEL